MIQTISIPAGSIADYGCVEMHTNGPLNHFPLLSVDQDSYIVQAVIQSGINFRREGGRHCIAVGKGCALADGITFMIDLNHEYASVCQGDMFFLRDLKQPSRIARKGSVIIQNDVWIGHGATIMAGVVLRNGCVIAAGSVVTKDVPPYAIVGGNPAKVLRYRFEPEIIDALQRIAWWDWPKDLQMKRRHDFTLPVHAFVEKYLPLSQRTLPKEAESASGCKTILFIPDVHDRFPLYPKVMEQYFRAPPRGGGGVFALSSGRGFRPAQHTCH